MRRSQGRLIPFPKQWIGLREFLRGGYQRLDQTTVIRNRNRDIAYWIPIKETETWVSDATIPSQPSHTEGTTSS